jgi:hypothetical protein
MALLKHLVSRADTPAMRWHPASTGFVACALGFAAVAPPAGAEPAPTARPRARSPAVLRAIHIDRGRSTVVIRLEATGTLLGELRTLDAPRRLYMDLAGVVPRVPRTIPVDRAGVHQVRVALNSVQPAVTRLVVDLTQPGTFRLERGASDRELRLTVATTAAAMRTAAATGEPVAVARAREPGPVPAAAARATAAYVAWFGSTAGRVGRLLDRSAALTPTDSAASIAQLQAEWTSLPRIVQGTPAASGFEAEHELLLASVRLGEVAMTRRLEATRLAAEASAGEAGAAMLLSRARTQLDKATSRVSPDTR